MGVSASCHGDIHNDLLLAIGEGDLHRVKILLTQKPKLVNDSFSSKGFSPLHYAASLGQPEVVSLLLEKGAPMDALNKLKQTPLMLACKNGRVACIELLIQKGANILNFDASHERTCLHYAAKGGHLQCLETILEAAKSPSVSQTWGFGRFINVRDGTGATALHLAASSCQSIIVRKFLTNGALVCATTTKTRRNTSLAFGSTPLHFAARGGSVECVKELLAWGADRLQRNSRGYTPFFIAMKYRNTACAALLNPLVAEPLVWPSPWTFMSNLEPEAKALLEDALAQANDAWEKRLFSTDIPTADTGSHRTEDNGDGSELCCICFERACTIEVLNCGHQMCARCTLALCCHNKPNLVMNCSPALSCPFCRCNIEQLRRAQPINVEGVKLKVEDEKDYDGWDLNLVCQDYEPLDKMQDYVDNEKDESRDLSMVIRAASNRSKKGSDAGNSGGFMGLVSKGSFRLISSAWGSSRVMDIDWENGSPSEHSIHVA